MNIFNRIYNRLFRVDRTADEVVELLNSLLDRTFSSEKWDYFISVEIVDPKLESIRKRIVEDIDVMDSPYMLPGSISPADLNQKGVAEIKKLIASLKKVDSGHEARA